MQSPKFELYIESDDMSPKDIAKVLREVASKLSKGNQDTLFVMGTCYNRWGDGVGHWNYNRD